VFATMEGSSNPSLPDVPILPGEGKDQILRILESITDGFYSFDPEWNFTFINEAGRRILLANQPEIGDLLGANYWDIFPATRDTIIWSEFHRAVDEGASREFEVFYHPWQLWYAVRCYPIRGGGLSVYFHDVTKEKEASAELRVSEERYRSLFNSIDEGFCVIEMIWAEDGKPVDYRFIEVNPSFENQTGLKDAEGYTIRELNPSHENIWFERYGKVANTRVPIRFVEGSDSLGRWFDVFAFPIGRETPCRVAVRFSDITEKKRAETEMIRLTTESRLRLAELETLLDVMPIGIGISLDRECRTIRLNSAFSQVLGLKPTDNASKTAPEGERPTNFIVLDDMGKAIADENLPMQVAARDGVEIRDVELNIIHNDGRRLRLLEYAAPLFDENGQPRGCVGAFVDITERRNEEDRQRFFVRLDDAVRPLSKAEDIVATAARLLGLYLHADRCAYADIEADEDTMNISGDYTRGVQSIVGRYTFTEFGQEVLRKMRADEPYVVDDIEVYDPALKNLDTYHATQIRSVICVPLHKEGKFVAAMAVHMKTPRHWAEDEVSLVLQVANRSWEAIERSRVSRVLKESEARFRQIADVMPQVVWMANPEGSIEYYNQRWYELTGRPAGEIGEQSWMPVMHPDDLVSSRKRWKQALAAGEPFEDRFRLQEWHSGEYRWFLSRAIPLRNERGNIERWYGTSTDIDDLTRAEAAAEQARAEAERANRAKDDFLATLSHELRTPLTPVLMAVEDLCADPTLSSSVQEGLQMMQRNISLEARLIDDLLDLTRITHGKLALRLNSGEAHSLIKHAVEIVQEDVQTKGLEMDVDLQASQSTLLCDPARLQQVFWNLLKNAIKFTPARGSITIKSFNEDDQLIVEVRDTGIGINSETLENIFLPFEQGGLSNDHRYGGLGLGLAISRTIVDRHGGCIQAESAGLNQGAVFRVKLPVIAEDTDSAGCQPELTGGAASPAVERELRLLLVEDHAATLTVLARLLRRAGHRVETASNVADALDLASRHTFDVVVSDIGLPDGTGIELMKQLHEDYGLSGVALTGYGMEEDHRLTQEAGFMIHLTKPVDFAQLRHALTVAAP
jgi:PAS domain S-box-containing protein